MLKIFIPAYNEEKIIESNIRDIYSLFSKKFKSFKLYLVDDGSTDNTYNIAKSIKLKNFFYVKCGGPSRRENLVQSMVKYSSGDDIVGFMDADRSTSEDVLDLVVKKLERQARDAKERLVSKSKRG